VHDDQKSGRRMLAALRREGETRIALAAEFPEMRAALLSWDEGVVPHELGLRRAMIALRVPPRLLVSLGRAIPGDGRKMIWLHLVRGFVFWLGVRESVSRDEWTSMTRGAAEENAP